MRTVSLCFAIPSRRMFIGHYGASFAAKRFAPKLSLAAYFVAAQLLDVFFSIFVMCGIEKMRIVPGFTQVNAYDLYFMPYTHSLVGSLAWSVAGAVVIFVATKSLRGSVAFGAVVFSHFVLDVPVHTPDLPIASESGPKLGFGLWNDWEATLLLELAVFGVGAFIYWQLVRPIGKKRSQLALFLGVMAALCVVTPFLPPPSGGVSFAIQALFGYFVLAFFAARIDKPSAWLS